MVTFCCRPAIFPQTFIHLAIDSLDVVDVRGVERNNVVEERCVSCGAWPKNRDRACSPHLRYAFGIVRASRIGSYEGRLTDDEVLPGSRRRRIYSRHISTRVDFYKVRYPSFVQSA